MKAIALFNNKGGVGKTTLLCNLAGYLAKELGSRVLVIDADPQCNATQSLISEDALIDLYEKPGAFTLWDVLQPLKAGRGYAGSVSFHRASNYGVDLLPGHPRLSLVEDTLSSDWLNATAGQVRGMRTTLAFAHLLQHCGQFDYVLFDMGPSLGAINRAVLIGCDYFVVPTAIDIFSLQAIQNISQTLQDWRRLLNRGLEQLDDADQLEISYPEWKLKFLGYVTQQYTTRRDESGKPRAVRAYDRILRRIPEIVSKELVLKYGERSAVPKKLNFHLGTVPYFHSLIPLSQSSHKPIFSLAAEDGVVGAHFGKVKEFEGVIAEIASNFEHNCEALQ